MLFAIFCIDKKDSLEVRKSNREKHLSHLKSLGERLMLAGPLYSGDDVANMNGSLIVIEADALEEAEEFAANDPYAQAGLFDSVEIRPWNLLINNTAE